ncbi:hypothetical protein B566_EDAN003934 [Ephemera danica]|nr:hypothetical protein B566_EDAN003934 [Ephemera danica]
MGQCKNLVPQNVTPEDFAGSWIFVETYFEFSLHRHQNISEQRKLLNSRCETIGLSLAEPNQLINETHLKGYSTSKSEEHELFATRNISFAMLRIGVFKAVAVSFRGRPLIFIGKNEDRDYMTLASCEDQDWFRSNASFHLITFRASHADYNSTMVQEMREKIKTTLDMENITPIPYRQDCT